MFCLFFVDGGEVNDLEDAKRADLGAFRKYFSACLDDGIYFAPSQYETGFLSMAHTESDIAETCEITAKALRSL